MVPTLLYLLFKKLRKQNWAQIKQNLFQRISSRLTGIVASTIFLLLLISIALAAKTQVRNFKITRKGSEIGWTTVQRSTDGNGTTFTLNSEVKVQLILTYQSVIKEISQFRNGKLEHSYYYRRTNGSTKADRHTKLV